ncbi:50S ribosomal protein L22 [Methanococcus maripaludis]|jgi:large subunit ribosomal protein L22|uniref:Large ribosomal subunit protein uL22 n=5 Tax=Methanococcus maripaludis TaxID=39152 RepID=RL22_METMP|nr:50S ribosomal protein L22 [Methanococcus maripaludis]P62649.1 RecName: Full=Large ribosomal subunit protein uL22; AltName: Full=50S ribosomal protein L22 [Methanococcus maripaludis S2]MDK2929200.1 large subunit ribosomal protein [Methanococcus sp.]AEK20423.1 50S ribosomal protein L22P [Methanococcus maripaludis X1]AVB76814.1 50S ribosomal protein L22 [Methanococcus maripaludis]MBA2847302.1 large subunit ribosomal protein L22 [Methanococcus maripaludis]MBA2850193.1 large subunit ribosomal p
MAKLKYKVEADPKNTARAMGRTLRISRKHAIELCRELSGMKLDAAVAYLNRVIALETPVPFKVHNKDLPHRKGKIGTHSGRFPQKASLEILNVLDNAKKNAEQKGLNTEKLRIKHISSNRGFTIKRYMPRAFGRASPKNQETIHIQVILEEFY